MSNKHKISVMISEDKLQEKIAEIGAKISADYEGKEIIKQKNKFIPYL